MTPAPTEAQRFLNALAPTAASFTFQCFDDGPAKDKRLARILHGTLDEHAAELARLSALGAGVFVTVNETDAKGRATENIVRVRAVFVDLDGAPLEPCREARLKPHIVVESSPGRWHCYWRVDDMPLADFTAVQKALIERFNADPSVHDLPRVMRLPGFAHQKATPFMTRLVQVSAEPPVPARHFARKAEEQRLAPPIGEMIRSPGRHDALASLARTLSARGVCESAIAACLHEVNRVQCEPPLAGGRLAEIDDIARWAAAKPVLSPMTEPDLDQAVIDMPVEELAAIVKQMEASNGNG